MESQAVSGQGGGTLGIVTGVRESVDEDGFVRRGFAVSTNSGDDVLYLADDFPIAFGSRYVITDLATETEVEGGAAKAMVYSNAIQVGDIITYDKNDKGEVNAMSIAFRAHHAPERDEVMLNNGELRDGGKYNDYFVTVFAFAPIEKLIENGFVINPKLDYLRTYMFGAQEGKGSHRLVMYDMAKNEFKDIKPADVMEGDRVFACKSNTNVEYIFVYRNMPQ